MGKENENASASVPGHDSNESQIAMSRSNSKSPRKDGESRTPIKAQLFSIDPEELAQSLSEDLASCEEVHAHLQACQRKVLDVLLEQRKATNATSFPVEAIRQVSTSGFLSRKELACFLLKTTRSFPKILGEESFYELLCYARWRASSRISPSIVQEKGYKWLYKTLYSLCNRIDSAVRSPAPVIPVGPIPADQLLGIVVIRSDDKVVVSEIMLQDTFDMLFDQSQIHDGWVEKSRCWDFPDQGMINPVVARERVTATMHLLHLETMSHCCLLDCYLEWGDESEIPPKFVRVFKTTVDHGYFYFSGADEHELFALELCLRAFSASEDDDIESLSLTMLLNPLAGKWPGTGSIPDTITFAEVISLLAIQWWKL
jgi:hypothetical protein